MMVNKTFGLGHLCISLCLEAEPFERVCPPNDSFPKQLFLFAGCPRPNGQKSLGRLYPLPRWELKEKPVTSYSEDLQVVVVVNSMVGVLSCTEQPSHTKGSDGVCKS